MANTNEESSVIEAPSYVELFNAVANLIEKLKLLESQASTGQTTKPDSSPSVDYRIPLDVGTSLVTK
jgi:hypothetical protein